MRSFASDSAANRYRQNFNQHHNLKICLHDDEHAQFPSYIPKINQPIIPKPIITLKSKRGSKTVFLFGD